MRELRLHPAPARPHLDDMLRKCAGYRMTADEIRAQRRSWVRGEMLLEHPEMTAEYVDRLMDEIEGNGG